jgi:hypothetical protein
LQDHNAAFEMIGDFDRNGAVEKALVGVYQNDSGERGRFLLILTQRKGVWTKQALFKNPGGTGFSVLQQSQRLIWAFCMESDGTYDVIGRRGRWQLECREP